MGWLSVVVRVFVGGLFVGAAYTKLFKDRSGKVAFFEKVGLRPGIFFLYFIGVIELIGGLMLMTGLLLPIVGIFLGTIIAAAALVKLKYPAALKNSVEFYLLWALVCFWIGLTQF